MKKVYSTLIIGFLFFAGMLAQIQETDVTPIKDNSIFEEGELSNGAGQHLFTGVTNLDKKRRALIKFDLEDLLPEGVLVDSAFLIITPTLVKTTGTHSHPVQDE